MQPSIGRDAEIEGALTMMSSGTSSGLLFTGDAGVGKTFLAEAVATVLANDPAHVWSIYANEVAGEIPFGALLANLPPDMAMSGIAPTIALKRQLAEHPGNVVIVVDDAPMLDSASAEALASAAESGMARLLITQRDGTLLPGPMRRMVRSGLVGRVECRPLADDATIELACHIARRPLTAAAEQFVIEHTQGNPLYVRELMLASLDVFTNDAATRSPLDLPRLPVEACRLQDLLRDRLAGLAPEEHEAIRWIAVTEPVGPGEVDHIDPGLLDRLESAGLIATRLNKRRIEVRISHPMHAELINASTPALTRRTMRGATATRIAALGARRREDRMRLATWSLDGDQPVDVEVLVGAARDAFSAGDVDLAVRLGTSAFDREPVFEHGRLLFVSLYEQGGREALEQHLATWKHTIRGSADEATFEMAAAKAGYWRFGHAEAPDDLIQRSLSAPAVSTRRELEAETASMFATAGRVTDTLALSEPLLGERPGRVMVLATLASGHGRRANGRPNAAVDLLDSVGQVYEALGPDVYVMSKNVLGSAHVQALAEAGRFAEASDWFDAIIAFARDSGSAKAAGLAQLAQGWSLCLQGTFDHSHRLFEGARRDLTIAQHPGMVRWAIAAQALGRAHAGDHATAADLIADFDAAGPHPAKIFDGLALRARAILAHHRGDIDAARIMLADAAESAERRGDLSEAIGCYHDLTRLGDARGAHARSRHFADVIDGEYWRLVLDYIAASASGESVRLAEIADHADALGCLQIAAECLTQAAHHVGGGSDRRVTGWLHRAEEIRDKLGIGFANGHVAPVLMQLTRREREVAHLAAQGLSSKTIASRLFVAERTVDSHLARLYNKLGVHGRGQLAVLVAGDLRTA